MWLKLSISTQLETLLARFKFDQFSSNRLERSISVQEIFTAEERMENSAGEQFHFALACWGAARSFDVGVCDAQGNEVSLLK